VRQIFVGAALTIAGVAVFVEDGRHAPGWECPHLHGSSICVGVVGERVPSGLSPTAYDVLRIGAWALVIVGALLVVTGLIRYWASVRSTV
jgi:hypothetical protein